MKENKRMKLLFNIRVLFEERLLKELNKFNTEGEDIIAELDEYSDVDDVLFDKIIFGIREPFYCFHGIYSINEAGKKIHEDHLYFYYDKRWTHGSVALIIWNRMKDLSAVNLFELNDRDFRGLFNKAFNLYVRFVKEPSDFNYKQVLVLSN